jgi:ankyrin repeat protein
MKGEQVAYGWTPLMCAVRAGHNRMVEFLIRKKTPVDMSDDVRILPTLLFMGHVC